MGDSPSKPPRRWRRRLHRVTRWFLLTGLVIIVALTAASFGFNLATNGTAPRPARLLMASGGGFDTRYREWGTTGTPIVLVPGAFETDAKATAQRIGAPAPVKIPGKHLTMIASPTQLAAVLNSLPPQGT